MAGAPRVDSRLVEDQREQERQRRRRCLVCLAGVPDTHRPYGFLETAYGNGLLCGRGPCLEAAAKMCAACGQSFAPAPAPPTRRRVRLADLRFDAEVQAGEHGDASCVLSSLQWEEGVAALLDAVELAHALVHEDSDVWRGAAGGWWMPRAELMGLVGALAKFDFGGEK